MKILLLLYQAYRNTNENFNKTWEISVSPLKVLKKVHKYIAKVIQMSQAV